MLPFTDIRPNPLNINDLMNDTTLSVGIQLGEIKGALTSMFKELSSENRILAAKVTQLEMIHPVELKAAVEGYEAARNLIVEKLKAVIERIKAFPEIHKHCGYVPLDPAPFQNIINELETHVLESHYSELKKYPKYDDKRLIKGVQPEQEAIVPFSIKQYPVEVQNQHRIIKTAEEIESIEAKIASLTNDNHALSEKIDVMISFHQQYLGEFNRLEKRGRIKEIVEKIRIIYNNIIWKVSIIDCNACGACFKEVSHLSPNVALKFLPVIHDQRQQEVNQRLNDMREHVLAAVTRLEELIL